MNEDGVTSANPNPSLPKPPSSPPTRAASSAGASSPAVPAHAGNGDAGRRDKSSADSHAVLGSGLQGAFIPSCRPWERGDLLRRLSTFKLAGKLPKVTGSLGCARRGWVNVDVAKIECEICGARLDFALPAAPSFEADASSEELSEQLDKGHKVTCPWRGNSCPESLVQFPPTSPSALIGGFKDRCDGLLQFYSLPIVSSSAVEQMQVTHSPQIDRLLAQLQIQTAGELGCRAENACGMSSTGEQAPHPYSYAQKLISLCGWEPRWLPNVLDCEEQSAESAKNGYSSGPAKGSAPAPAPAPAPSKKEFSTSSRKDTGDNDVLGSEFNCESRSPLLDCSLCGATVRVWDFLTAPRPVHLTPCGIDTPQTSKKIASTRGISAASGINEWAAADGVEKERTGDRDEATTSDKRQLVSNKSLDLSLKMASGPSCSPINLNSTSGHVQDAGEGKDLMIGRTSGSEVGDQAASYESRGPNAHKRKLDDGETTADRPHLNTQQADSAEKTITDRDNNEIIGSQQYSAGPFKRARDTNILETFQFPLRNSSDVIRSHSSDIQIEPDANIANQLNPERDHAIGILSTRDSAHASSIIAMNTVYHSSDDESMESVENFPVDVNDVNFPSVDLNETSELNSSYQVQQSACFQPLLERAGGETGVSSSNACGEVLNTEILTAHARDGPSFGISGGSVGMGASHEAEIHGTDVSVHRGDSLGDVEPIAEVIENQGQAGEFEPYHGLIGDFVPEEMSREDPQGDSQAVVSQSTARADSGSKVIASTKVESVESGEKTSSSMQVLGLENGAHPSLSCNAVVCSAYEVSREEVTQTGKASHIDDGAYHESGHLVADVMGTPYRDNSNGGVEFDLLKLHNDYCPWVNGDVAAAGCDNPCPSSGVGSVALCGWQLTLDALDSFQSLGHLPVQTLESESAASMCKGDRFTSSQKLLARNSYVRNHGRN
ncbi:NIPA protein [Spatholobus suberectus]|nr:NIPA protein [Spatholobus suberectus]